MHIHDGSQLRHIHPERRDTGEFIGKEFSLDERAGETYRDKPVWTAEQAGAYLNRSGWDWYSNNYDVLGGTDRVLTFGFWNNFRELSNSYYLSEDGNTGFSEVNINTFSIFNNDQRIAARENIQLWDDLISISFREDANAARSDIAFGNTDTGGAQAYAYLPFGNIFDAEYEADAGSDWQVGKLSGDVWVDNTVASNFFPLGPSYYGYSTLVHETGHALGLSHPGDYDALDDADGDGEPDPISYANSAEYAQDTLQYSIMSYWDALETGAQHIDWSLLNFAYAATPLVHDVVGIQAIYGADTRTRTGDTVYGFNSTAGRTALDFTLNTRPIVTIWDAGGNDTLDFSGWNTRSVINLNEGAFSSGGGVEEFQSLEQVNANRVALGFAPRSQATYDAYMGIRDSLGLTSGLFTDNISIAYGAKIENAVGGGGDDLIIVNALANRVVGGLGVDTVSYETSLTRVVAHLNGTEGRAGALKDTLAGVENLRGSDHNDQLFGDAKDNTFDGGTGSDLMTGGAGADTFVIRTNGVTSGADRMTDFDARDVLAVDITLAARNGVVRLSPTGVINLDGGGDRAVVLGVDPASGLRFLGADTDGLRYYAKADVRPDETGDLRVFEGTVGDNILAGRGTTETDLFFFDTGNAAPGTGDDQVTFTANDLFVTTTRLAGDAITGAVTLTDGVLQLTGNGGAVSLSDGSTALTGLEFDGSIIRDGVEYFIYSTTGSSVGAGDVFFDGFLA